MGSVASAATLIDRVVAQPWYPAHLNVRLRHIADVPLALTNVRFEGNNGHDADVLLCWLMTQSGNREWPKCANGRGKFQPIFVTGNKSIVVSHRTPQWPEEFSNVLG
jgi:hypothetical protein